MSVRGLTITLGEPAPARLRTALVLLLATAALGGRARLFLEGRAVALLAGTPDPLWADALDGIAVIVCQTGLADAGLDAATLDPRLVYGGPVGVLAELGEDRLAIG